MAVDDEAGRILLLGGSGAGTDALLAAIRGQEGGDQPDGYLPWHLDTKYYTAQVVIDVRHVDQSPQLQLKAAGYEAVLLVFDAGQQASFDSVQRWFEAAGGSDADLGVRLAVGTQAAGVANQPAKPTWLRAAEEWCAEQLVEYVEVGDAAPQEADDRGREGATGVQRIREALHAHMWPGLQLKPSPRHGLAAAQPPAPATHAEAAGLQGGLPVRAANGVHAGSSGSSSPTASQVGPSFSDYLRDPEQAIAAAGGAGSGPGAEEEAEVEQLEQLFAQVASHRAQLAHLPDAQRREAAAAMVMQLMATMGLEEGEH